MIDLSILLSRSSAHHDHLCPRQVLGVRAGLAGAAALGLDLPRNDKRLLVIVETDGCFVDGIEAACGATVGHRMLRVEDYGKVAATFVDVSTGRAVRVSPRLDVRQRAQDYTNEEGRHYFAQLHAYQVMPESDLLDVQPVYLTTPIQAIVNRAGLRVACDICGEEIINNRQVSYEGMNLCKACAGQAYYQPVLEPAPLPIPCDARF